MAINQISKSDNIGLHASILFIVGFLILTIALYIINGVLILGYVVDIILVMIVVSATFSIARLLGIGDTYYVKDDSQ